MPDDAHGIYRMAEDALARYAASRAARPDMLGLGANALRSQAALVGANGQATDAAVGAYEAALPPNPDAQDADEARWRAWWGASNATATDRLKGLGDAAEGAYKLALKRHGKKRSGGTRVLTPATNGNWTPYGFTSPARPTTTTPRNPYYGTPTGSY